MEVILLQDVAKVGRRNELKEVKEGFARNFLFKKGLAVAATAATKEALATRIKLNAAEDAKNQELKQLAMKKLAGIVVTIGGKASDKGHLFEGIKKEEILSTLERDHRLILEAADLLLDKPLKAVGETKIPIQGGGELKVNVVGK